MSALTYTGPLWIPGKPEPKGSHRCVTPHVGGQRSVLKNDNAALAPWEAKVAQVVGYTAGKYRGGPLDAPVELVTDFYIGRPAKPMFDEAPAAKGTGDLDKLVRAVGDAVSASRVWVDDARVVRIVAEKLWAHPGRPAGARIELRPYVPPPATPCGAMAVRLQCGRLNTLIGSIGDIRGLPNLLRRVADRIEAQGHTP